MSHAPKPVSRSPRPSVWIRNLLIAVIAAIITAIGTILAAILPLWLHPSPGTTSDISSHPVVFSPQLSPTLSFHPSPSLPLCSLEKMLDEIWQVTQGCGILHIHLNNGITSPELASLDLSSSYFRLNYGPDSSWGTSIVLLPSFWSQAACPPSGLCQGAPVMVQPRTEGTDLLLTIDGFIGKLHVLTVVRLSPPTNDTMTAQVKTTLEGTVKLDTNRPNQAFKPIMLASMHVSSAQWDAQRASVDDNRFALPSSNWILSSPINANRFGLDGGTSSWKTNAPTLEVVLVQPTSMKVAGWVTESNNPNDDNVALWAGSNTLLYSWSYTATALKN